MFKAFALSLNVVALAVPVFADVTTFDFTGFEAIEAEDSVIVNITTGSNFAVRAEADNASLQELNVDLSDGALTISRDTPWGLARFRKQEDVMVYVTMPSLNWLTAGAGAEVSVNGGQGLEFSVFAASDAQVTAQGISYATIDADVRNGARVNLSGECGTLNGASHSDGRLNAGLLDCARAKTVATSGGVISLNDSLAEQETADPWDLEEPQFAERLQDLGTLRVDENGMLY